MGSLIRVFLLCALLGMCFMQGWAQKTDSTYFLLHDEQVQFDVTDAMDAMYDFSFDEALLRYNWLKDRYPWHPLPYFLIGLNQWWKIIPNPQEKKYDKQFIAYMDSAIYKAKKMLNKPYHRAEATFFLAAAYGFKGQLYSDEERSEYRKAVFVAKNALKYLKESIASSEFSDELLIGNGLYNYYSVWIRENYPSLRPIMFFFKRGNKELGIEQLRRVAYNAFYTRIEAQVFLIKILPDEGQKEEAFEITSMLHKRYPNNGFFHKHYAKNLYLQGKYTQLKYVSEQMLQRIDSLSGYTAQQGRYASFFLGQYYDWKRTVPQAKKYYEQSIAFADESNAQNKGYTLLSLLRLGDISLQEKDTTQAIFYYQKVKKRGEKTQRSYKKAKENLKKIQKTKRKKYLIPFLGF